MENQRVPTRDIDTPRLVVPYQEHGRGTTSTIVTPQSTPTTQATSTHTVSSSLGKRDSIVTSVGVDTEQRQSRPGLVPSHMTNREVLTPSTTSGITRREITPPSQITNYSKLVLPEIPHRISDTILTESEIR